MNDASAEARGGFLHLVVGVLVLTILGGGARVADAEDEHLEIYRKIQAAMRDATSADERIRAMRPYLRSDRPRYACHVAYKALIGSFRTRDLAPLRRAFEREVVDDKRLWLASIADDCGDRTLFRRLALELPKIRDPLDRARIAIGVAFKTGDAAAVPALIAALERSDPLLGHTTVGVAAEYALVIVTNHYGRPDHPATLWNYQCFVMPPPVDPFPAPSDVKGPLRPAVRRSLVRFWRDWWRSNRTKKRIEWVRNGIDRDVELLAKGAGSAAAQRALEARARIFLGELRERDLPNVWPGMRATYRLPPRRAR